MLTNATFGRGRALCWLGALASSAAFLLAFQSDALAYQFGEPDVRATGQEEIVFDYSSMKCHSEDIPDSPAHAFRDSQNQVQLIASHASVRRKIGPSLGTVQHKCPIVMDSHGNQDAAAFDDREWLSSVYTPDGQTVYGLTSTEYHGWEYDEACAGFVASGNHLKCWYNSIGLTKSVNAGASYTHATAPSHLVASSPYRYAAGNGPLGVFDPSNIIYRQSDGHYYVMVRVEGHGAQQRGACLMRTQSLDDPTSWRAWDGTGFGVRFMNPYVESGPPEDHVCQVLSPASLGSGVQTGSLTYSTYFGQYLLVGVSRQWDPVTSRWREGFWFSLSSDLINWSQMKILMEAALPWTHQCGQPDPVRDASLIDPASTSRNFDTVGRHPYLYFTRFNKEYASPNNCWISLDRDLVRIPIEFTDENQPPAPSFTPSPNPAPTGQTVTFDGSASSDPDGSIARYEWDLDGDGSFERDTGTTATVARSYPSAAVLTIRLRVTDNQGAAAETSRSLTVSNRLPTASFSATPNPADAGQVVAFNGSASSDPDGTITKYEWDLNGDSTFETDSGSTPTITMSYPAAATITVRLRVTDSDGGTAQTTRSLTINPPPPANQLPTASFTLSPNPAPTGQTVTFDGSASTDPDGTIAKHEWDLDGDGSFETDTGTTATVSRSYSSAAALTVKLRVTDNDGATNDTSRTLTVSNRLPTASFTAAPNPALAGQVVSFDGSASGDPDGSIARYEWDLDGDSTFETDSGPTPTTTKSYPAAASVTVRLRVTDSDGGNGQATVSLIVNTPPPPPPPPPVPTPGPPGPQGPPAAAVSPSAGACATARTKRARLTKRLRSARRKLAKARTASAKSHYRRLIRKLIRQRKRLQSAGCRR